VTRLGYRYTPQLNGAVPWKKRRLHSRLHTGLILVALMPCAVAKKGSFILQVAFSRLGSGEPLPDSIFQTTQA
jgi:hypothetical protein